MSTQTVKVGDKVRIIGINAGGHSGGGRYYNVGQVGEVLDVYPSRIRVDLSAYSLPLSHPVVGNGDWEVIPTDPVAFAEENLKKAQAELEAAKKAAEAAKTFTLADLKPGLVVHFPCGQDYRFLISTAHGWVVVDPKDMRQSAGAPDNDSMVRTLNSMYAKTNKTLKDIL
jgi:hypothetical protein